MTGPETLVHVQPFAEQRYPTGDRESRQHPPGAGLDRIGIRGGLGQLLA
jgi:hypothetical protein